MKKILPLLGALALGLNTSGCGKSGEMTAEPLKPAKAVSQLQQAFAGAPAEVQQPVQLASQALQSTNYEQAIQSVRALRARRDLTADQSLAIYSCSRTLEDRVIAAMVAGDPNAKRAYEMLRKH